MKYGNIGVTGLTTEQEAKEIVGMLPLTLDRKVVLGVLASPETLVGERPATVKRYPDLWDINSIFQDNPYVINELVYETENQKDLYYDLLRIMEVIDTNVDAIRLNAGWVEADILKTFHQQYPGLQIGLQVTRSNLIEVQYESTLLAKKVGEYRDSISELQIDCSPHPFHPMYIRDFLRIVVQRYPEIQLTLGGLCHQSIDMFPKLLETFAGISVDGSYRLRDESDSLNMWRTKAFITKAITFYDSFKKKSI